MTHVHMSLLHGVDDAAVAAHVRRTITRLRPRSMSTTESDGFRAELGDIPGYVTIHPTGGDGQTECALIVAKDALGAVLPAVRLSGRPVPRRGGEHVYATPADLAGGSQILALHMPSGVEAANGFRTTDEARGQVEAYRETIGGLRRYVATHPEVDEIYADWNLRADLEWVRDYFALHFPDFVIVAPATATHAGGRVIDWALIRKGHGRHIATAEPNPVSDHETVVITRQERRMKLVTRAQWGARPRGATISTHPIGKTLGISAHWEGPHMGAFPHEKCAEKVRGIEAFHRDGRGWADIAYNALACPHGFVFEGRGPGVKSAANGDTQTNEDWYAVCYLGGEGDGLTAAGKQAYLDAFGWLAREGAAGPKRNGHRDHKATACPGDEIYRWVSALPDGAGAPAVAPPAPATPTRVTQARVLLRDAAAVSGPLRKAAILAGLAVLPKR